MARAGFRDIVVALAASSLLLGCVEGGGTSGEGGGATVPAPKAKKSGAQDVEAPEVFQTTDSALWDGRPSLGGIWVAAPEVTNPERAVLFNPATGKSVTGALFRRERENPGPRLQLSSDAAEALGILAGQPTEIRVTALRKAEVEEPAAAEEAAPVETAEGEPAKDGDAAAIASAALAAVDAEAAPEAAAKTDTPAKGSADPAAAAAATAGAAVAATGEAAAAVTEAPKKKTWKERRAEARAAREAKKKAAAEAKAATAEAQAALAPGDVPPDTTPTASAETVAVAPIEAAPLDARDPAAVASDPAPAPKRRTVGDTPAPDAKAAAAKADAEPAAPVVASGPARPIQVASFSKEDNATRAAQALAKIGITGTPQKSEKGGKAVWGVIVQGDEAMLKKIKDAGFADAYFLK